MNSERRAPAHGDPIFTYELAVDRADAPEVLEAVLHTICFLRLLGPLRPATAHVLGVETPRVTDEQMRTLIRTRCDDLLHNLDASRQSGPQRPAALKQSADVCVSWMRPEDAPQERATVPAVPDAPDRPVFHSPYSWLASALAGGRNTPEAGAPRKSAPLAHTLAPGEFERWVLRLRVHYGDEPAQAATAAELREFVVAALTFVGAHQTHVPAITSAGLCPFPVQISSATVAE